MNQLRKFFMEMGAVLSLYSCSGDEVKTTKTPDISLEVLVTEDAGGDQEVVPEVLPNVTPKRTIMPPTYVCADGLPPKAWMVDRDNDNYFAKATVGCEHPQDGNVYLTSEELKLKTGREIPLLDCDGWDDNPTVHPYAPDLCDGLDNDCDLHVDEDQPSVAKPCNGGAFTFCEGLQFQYCLDGKLSDWSQCMEVVVKEFCDGKDNDCNGIVDDIEQKVCTTACGTGVEMCVNGALTCDFPQKDPTCCEPVGMVKDKELCPPTHYTFIVDASSSTTEATAAVREALTQFADAHEIDDVLGGLGMIIFRDIVIKSPYGMSNDETEFKKWVQEYTNEGSLEGHLNALMDVAQTFNWPESGRYHAILVSDSHFDVFGEEYNSVTQYTTDEVKIALHDKSIYLTVVQVYGISSIYYSLNQYDTLTEGIGQHLDAPDDEGVIDAVLSLMEPYTFTFYRCNELNQWEYVNQCKK